MTKKQDKKVFFRDSDEGIVENRKHKIESGRYSIGNKSRHDTITAHFATPPNPDKVQDSKTKK